MKNITHIYTILLCLTLFFLGCSKDNEPEPAGNQSMTLNFSHQVADNKPLDFRSVFTTNAGNRYTISMFRYYLSNIRLIKTDGSEYRVNDKYLLVTPAIANYDLGEVPTGGYKGIRFSVGIDSVTNHKDPTVYPVTNPLAIQSPAIHWSWNSGYIFTMIEGSCDTTVYNTDTLTYGQFSHGMFFHIGMDPYLRQVDLGNSPFTVSKKDPFRLNIVTTLNKFFDNIDLKKENTTHTFGNFPLAGKAANNLPGMFSIKP